MACGSDKFIEVCNKGISGIVKVMNTIKQVKHNKVGKKTDLWILCIQKLPSVKVPQLYSSAFPKGEYTLKVLQANDEYILFCFFFRGKHLLTCYVSHFTVMLFACNLVTPGNPHFIAVFI